MAEVGNTVTVDHPLQMATSASEHKPTVLGIPGHVPIPHHLECTIAVLQSLHAPFRLLTTGSTLASCPQVATFAKALGTAARHDNGHIASLASGRMRRMGPSEDFRHFIAGAESCPMRLTKWWTQGPV